MNRFQKTIAGLGLLLLAASCTTVPAPIPKGTYKVGTPYQIDGVWYYPKEDPFYDETGVASWYGSDFHGKSTANGESYNMDALTAAHRTLPLPSIVRVTNLENGKSIRLRVNDRGPYARGRILDVSRRAADLLGFQRNGTARVRVQYEGRGKVADPLQSADLDENQPLQPGTIKAAPVTAVAASELAPPPGASAATAASPLPPAAATRTLLPDTGSNEPDGVVTLQAVPPATRLWIQLGSFSARSNAERLVASLAGVGTTHVSTVVVNGKAMHRVRLGPFNALPEADSMLDKVIAAGQNGAQIIVE